MLARVFLLLIAFASIPCPSLLAQNSNGNERAEYVRSHYSKFEHAIPMRDGTQLFTAVYVPNGLNNDTTYPIIMVRTPYSIGPYGIDQYRSSLGPSEQFEKDGYIFVYQDVRGRYMSEGTFVNMRPHIDNKTGQQFDEASDTYDTIDWLVNNIPNNNGRVGQWGISYPGFYSSAGMIDSHPALKAVSPQAPISDWYFDDFHRNGAFVLPMAFNFFYSFGRSRPEPTTEGNDRFEHPTKDGYQFFLDLGPLSNVDKRHYNEEIGFWNSLESHPNYDEFWQSRNLLPHLNNISANVLVVGGWFDTEDLYGPLKTYASVESKNPNTNNTLVMGPWYHGQWNRDAGQKLGDADFDFPTGEWFRENVQLPFFETHLKGDGTTPMPEAIIFETGANRWRTFDHWPPKSMTYQEMNFADNFELTAEPVVDDNEELVGDSFLSDPSKPVPYTMEITSNWARNYVTEDQRFAAWRPDVLVYRNEVQEEDLTVAGPIFVDLWVTSDHTDADWVVKIVDEFPGKVARGDPSENSSRQQLVRAGVIRGRFRESFENPKPMVPGEPTRVRFEVSDICHTFKKGHRLMIQVQSSWFPFIDRNPQKYVENIFEATESDFQTAEHTLLRSKAFPSRIQLPILK
jgi:putative CocE/NonD family hydrolase